MYSLQHILKSKTAEKIWNISYSVKQSKTAINELKEVKRDDCPKLFSEGVYLHFINSSLEGSSGI